MAPYRRAADAAGPGEDLSATIIACAAVMIAVSTLAIGLRFYVRGRLLRTLASEDWCILAAWVFAGVSTGWTIKEAKVALGRHAAHVSAGNIMAYLQAAYVMALFYNLSLCFTKISILLLYLRVLKTYDYIRKAIYITLGVVIVYNTWALLMYLTMCIPIAKMWDATITNGYCHPRDVWWALTYIHIITDFMIFTLPIPVVLSMSVPALRKAGLLLVFCIGFFLCLVSVLRAIWLKALYTDIDITWDLTSIANWSVAEINIAIVCACLTTLKPLLKKAFGPLIDRVFPPRDISLESGQGDRPLTIGSVPLKVVKGHGDLLDPAAFTALDSIGTTTVVGGDTSGGDRDSDSGRSKDRKPATTLATTSIDAPPGYIAANIC